jgi:cardiolipin synthase
VAPAHAAEAAEPDPQARVVTIPNAISMARLAGVPSSAGWCSAENPGSRHPGRHLLFAAGASDWLDGKTARAQNQQSKLGKVLDPAADRLYIVVMLFALAIRAIIPWWLVGLLVGREIVLGVALLRLRSRGYPPLQVSFVGKAATLCLFYAFPLLLLGAHAGTFDQIARIAGWAMAFWGTALYWCAAGLYLVQARSLLGAAGAEQVDSPP